MLMWQAVLLSLWGMSSLPHSVAEAMASCDESDAGNLLQISREKDVKYEAPDMSMWESEAAHLLEKLAFVDISFTCPASNLKLLEEEVLKRSDPKNPLYGKWLSKEGVKKFCPPTGAAKVVQWLVSQGLEEVRHFFQLEEGSRIRLQDLTVQQVETLFVTKVRKFTKDGLSILRALDFHLPPDVDEAISAIYGLHGLPADGRPKQPSRPSPSFVQSRQPTKTYSSPSQELQQLRAANSRAQAFFHENQIVAGQAQPDYVTPPNVDMSSFGITANVPKSELSVPKGLHAKSGPVSNQTGNPDPDVAPLPRQVTHALFESAGSGGGYSLEAAKRGLKLNHLPMSPIEVIRTPPTEVNLNNNANEANTDIQVMLAAAPGVPLKIYSYTNNSWAFSHQLKDWYLKMLAEEEPPLAASNSFGTCQYSPKEPPSIQRQFADLNHDMLRLAARGISMFVASGDNGAAYGSVTTTPLQWKESQSIEGAYNMSLTLPSIEACDLACIYLNEQDLGGSCQCGAFSFDNETGSCHTFCLGTPYSLLPSQNQGIGGPDIIDEYQGVNWPGASPWITSVGAVTEEAGKGVLAVQQIGSGGGFTNLGISGFETPQWQQAAVQSFLKKSAHSTIKPSPKGFNPQGRALPDVSAFGEKVMIYYIKADDELGMTPIMGTSVAAPLVAALVSRLNLLRSAESLPPMGFINPWLYSYPHMMKDVTVGRNNIPKNGGYGPSTKYGFSATQGWDAVTGLGVPSYPAMASCAFAMFSGKEGSAENCFKYMKELED